MGEMVGARREISRCHSVSVGFDIEAGEWPFAALTYFGEDPAQRVAYLTLFPLPSGLRVNLFVYRELNDPWFKRLRDNPAATIAASLPQLARFTGALEVKGPLKIRPVDLVATDNVLQPGVVLVGDAFSTACPVSGTGAAKALLDAERLCNMLRAGLARDPRHGRGEDRAILQRSRTSAAPTRIPSAPPYSPSARRWAKACCGPRSAGAILPVRRRRNFLEHGELVAARSRRDCAGLPTILFPPLKISGRLAGARTRANSRARFKL